MLRDQHEPHQRVRRGVACRRNAVEPGLGVGGHDDHRDHLEKCRAALHGVVGVEPRGVDGVAVPGPPDDEQEERVAGELRERVVARERRAHLRHRSDEDEVEEELDPRDLAVAGRANRTFVARAWARRNGHHV
jgi:hypothetical protein